MDARSALKKEDRMECAIALGSVAHPSSVRLDCNGELAGK